MRICHTLDDVRVDPVRRRFLILLAFPLLALAAPKTALGVFAGWAAFAEPGAGRCYAIARAERGGRAGLVGFASIGFFPGRGVRAQPHFRLSRPKRAGSAAILTVDGRPFQLAAGGTDAWPRDRRADAGVVAAMRGGTRMRVASYGADGRRFVDSYPLRGAATAIDAAAAACIRR